uniref:Minor capsid protein P8 central region domain-containing protein n=1 Tax=viral metagenome TaxID=1070528 RepID=A0A6C0AZY8_9ZZZZ
MDYYKNVSNYLSNPTPNVPQGLNYGTVNTFNAINIPYGGNLLPSNVINRNTPTVGTFGPNYVGGQTVQPLSIKGPQNTQVVKQMNDYFFSQQNPSGVPQAYSWSDDYANVDLQTARPGGYNVTQNQLITTNPAVTNTEPNPVKLAEPTPKQVLNYYVIKAAESLHHKPNPLMMVFFSDDNINHLRNIAVQKIQQITADSGVAGDKNGVTIQPPNMDDFFYYMINVFQTYNITNGSICFVNLKKNSDLKSDIAKLNTNVLQEYVSKMVSQINMYIYYYKDASQLPEQLSLPTYSSMKGSRSLEYNTGFQSGNSIGVASYNEVGNII